MLWKLSIYLQHKISTIFPKYAQIYINHYIYFLYLINFWVLFKKQTKKKLWAWWVYKTLLIFNVYNLVNLMISIYLLNHHYNLCYEYTHHFQVFPSFFIYYNYFVIRAQHKIYPLSIFFCVRMPSLLDGKFHLYMGQICFVFHYVPCI